MLNVLPANAATRFGDATLRDSEAQCEAGLGFWRFSDFSNYFRSQRLLNSASTIYRLGNELKMIRIHARRNSAQMVEHQPKRCFRFGNGSLDALIVNAVRGTLASIVFHSPISMLFCTALPNPARRFVATIFDDVVDGRYAAGMAFQVWPRLSLHRFELGIVSVNYGCFVAASAVAKSKRYVHERIIAQ